ncbi:MAG: hypothetical protein Q8880_03815 [Bacteroidota bacterium]|nr:hypothetical protein [Bacteroidota bacterium]
MENKENFPEKEPGFMERFGFIIIFAGSVIVIFILAKILLNIL